MNLTRVETRDETGTLEVRFQNDSPELLDRDLSWLEFNRRVLAEARDPRNALLDRLMFLGIFTSNLDYGSLTNFPFQVLGFLALLILFAMAATSHDFFQRLSSYLLSSM